MGSPPDAISAKQADVTLGCLRDEYLPVHRQALEQSTITGVEIRFKHLVRILGEAYPMHELSQASLQTHADGRSKMFLYG